MMKQIKELSLIRKIRYGIMAAGLAGVLGGCYSMGERGDPVIDAMPRFAQPGGYRDAREKALREEQTRQSSVTIYTTEIYNKDSGKKEGTIEGVGWMEYVLCKIDSNDYSKKGYTIIIKKNNDIFRIENVKVRDDGNQMSVIGEGGEFDEKIICATKNYKKR